MVGAGTGPGALARSSAASGSGLDPLQAGAPRRQDRRECRATQCPGRLRRSSCRRPAGLRRRPAGRSALRVSRPRGACSYPSKGAPYGSDTGSNRCRPGSDDSAHPTPARRSLAMSWRTNAVHDDERTAQPHPLSRAGGQAVRLHEIVSRMPDKSLHRYTYARFYRRARRLAEALQRAGLKQAASESRRLMWNHYAHFEAYFGVIVAGACMHTLNLRLAAEDIAFIANHAEDRFLIVDDVLLPLFEQFRAEEWTRTASSWCRSRANRCRRRSLDYEELLQTATGDLRIPRDGRGRSRARCATRRAPPASPRASSTRTARRSCTRWCSALPDAIGHLAAHDVLLPVVPMFHANAWGIPYAAAMLGMKMVFPGPHLHPDGSAAAARERAGDDRAAACRPSGWRWCRSSRSIRASGSSHPGLRLTGGRLGRAGSADPRLRQAGHPGHPGLGHDRDLAARHDLAMITAQRRS